MAGFGKVWETVVQDLGGRFVGHVWDLFRGFRDALGKDLGRYLETYTKQINPHQNL